MPSAAAAASAHWNSTRRSRPRAAALRRAAATARRSVSTPSTCSIPASAAAKAKTPTPQYTSATSAGDDEPAFDQRRGDLAHQGRYAAGDFVRHGRVHLVETLERHFQGAQMPGDLRQPLAFAARQPGRPHGTAAPPADTVRFRESERHAEPSVAAGARRRLARFRERFVQGLGGQRAGLDIDDGAIVEADVSQRQLLPAPESVQRNLVTIVQRGRRRDRRKERKRRGRPTGRGALQELLDLRLFDPHFLRVFDMLVRAAGAQAVARVRTGGREAGGGRRDHGGQFGLIVRSVGTDNAHVHHLAGKGAAHQDRLSGGGVRHADAAVAHALDGHVRFVCIRSHKRSMCFACLRCDRPGKREALPHRTAWRKQVGRELIRAGRSSARKRRGERCSCRPAG